MAEYESIMSSDKDLRLCKPVEKKGLQHRQFLIIPISPYLFQDETHEMEGKRTTPTSRSRRKKEK